MTKPVTRKWEEFFYANFFLRILGAINGKGTESRLSGPRDSVGPIEAIMDSEPQRTAPQSALLGGTEWGCGWQLFGIVTKYPQLKKYKTCVTFKIYAQYGFDKETLHTDASGRFSRDQFGLGGPTETPKDPKVVDRTLCQLGVPWSMGNCT